MSEYETIIKNGIEWVVVAGELDELIQPEANILVEGDLIVRGALDVKRLEVGGSLKVGRSLKVGGWLKVSLSLEVGGWLNVGGPLEVGLLLEVGGSLEVGGAKNILGLDTDIYIWISCLHWPVYIMSRHIKIGCEMHTREEWEKFSDKKISLMDSNALDFWKQNKDWILKVGA